MIEKEKFDYAVYSDDEQKHRITTGLNVAMTKLRDCMTKEDSDEWVTIISDWFNVAIENYPKRENELLKMKPLVMAQMEEIRNNYVENARNKTVETEEVGNELWFKKTYELMENFDTVQDLDELEKRIEQQCSDRMFNHFRLILMDNEYSPRRIIYKKHIPEELVDKARELLAKMKTLSEKK